MPTRAKIEVELLFGPVLFVERDFAFIAACDDCGAVDMRRRASRAWCDETSGMLEPLARLPGAGLCENREAEGPFACRTFVVESQLDAHLLGFRGSEGQRSKKEDIFELDRAAESAARKSCGGHLKVPRSGNQGLADFHFVFGEQPLPFDRELACIDFFPRRFEQALFEPWMR